MLMLMLIIRMLLLRIVSALILRTVRLLLVTAQGSHEARRMSLRETRARLRIAVRVPHEINFLGAIRAPQIHVEDEHGEIDFVGVDLHPCGGVGDDQSYTGRGRDRPAVFVPEATHACAFGLLHDVESGVEGSVSDIIIVPHHHYHSM
jgi:hypothetical protein